MPIDNDPSDNETLFLFNIIFFKFYFRSFVQPRKAHLHRPILPMFTVNDLKKCMTNFRLVRKNDVTLPYKYDDQTFTIFLHSFSISDRKNLHVLNFILIYLFLLN